MKTPAAIYVEAGKPQVVDDVDLPDPGPTQILVKQFATGICHSQLHELNRPNPTLPLVLGHESTGAVVAKGKDVTHVKEGDHVMVTWVQRYARPGVPRPSVANVTYKGQTVAFGAPAFTGVFTWSEHTVADEQMIVPLDKDVPTDVTAPVGCAIMTGAGAAMNAAMVRPGESVVVIGVGGVGLSVVQAAANLGAYPVIVVDLADDKLEFAKQFGATHGINASKVDPIKAVQDMMGGGMGAGVDHAFDAIGSGRTMEQILHMARARQPGEREGGQAILVGVPHGETPPLPMGMLFGGKVYRGAPGGCCIPDRDFPILIRWFKEGKFPLDKLVTKRYKLEQINEGCDALAKGQIAGRAIIEF
ncbi:MAG: zinc-binding dehydrogenase [Chloroflexi bacterium]|nr:zinc-binding dehydrogenase [Chloroflexota bacterium]